MLLADVRTARRNSGVSCLDAPSNAVSDTRTVSLRKPSKRSAYSSSARSPRLRTASRIGRTVSSASVKRAALRANNRPASLLWRMRITAPCVSSFGPVNHRGIVGGGVCNFPLALFQPAEEATLIAFVAHPWSDRLHLDEHSVAIAIGGNLLHREAVSRAFAFHPQFLPRA